MKRKIEGQYAKIRLIDIPAEVREKYGEQFVNDPNTEADVQIVSEVSPDVVVVRYRDKQFPVNKKTLKYAEYNPWKERYKKMSDEELMNEYRKSLSLISPDVLDTELEERIKDIEEEINKRAEENRVEKGNKVILSDRNKVSP